MASTVKQEIIERPSQNSPSDGLKTSAVIDLSSGSSSSDSDSSDEASPPFAKKPRVSKESTSNGDNLGLIFPVGFLEPLPPDETASPSPPASTLHPTSTDMIETCKQFWKAGDYEGDPVGDSASMGASAGMDHVRVHPKFLHSNATSHKWALGAFAELLDNSLDEVCNGATYVSIDVLENKKDKSRMLLIEDNGGGMDPERMRQCMSLGYSVKSKLSNTIGQYGNGFKTSTMRLGADVIVFSRCHGKDGKSPTQSIGLLSYTFLRSTRKEDIIVPMVDFEKEGKAWNKQIRSSPADWQRNIETIVRWSPYSSEADLLSQFNMMKDKGTRIIIYNPWENDQGELELDFCTDQHDIQLRGVNRDEKKIHMAKQFPNSKHFLTYQHSLRSYASILYLRLPPCFRIILRGKDVEHHNIVNDMMLKQQVTYRPQSGSDRVPKDPNMVAEVTMGFVKDAKHHIDVQGFNVYHKNRLIKPFWRVWNATGSDGRGVIGVLEANFVEPAHDKQGFERTTVLARLEGKLILMQKNYWSTNCHKVGYAPRRNRKQLSHKSSARESSPGDLNLPSRRSKDGLPSRSAKSRPLPDDNKSASKHKQTEGIDPVSSGISKTGSKHESRFASGSEKGKNASKFNKKLSSLKSRFHERSPSRGNESDDEIHHHQPERQLNGCSDHKSSPAHNSSQKDSPCAPKSSFYSDNSDEEEYCASKGSNKRTSRTSTKASDDRCHGNVSGISNFDAHSLKQLEEENVKLKERIKNLEESMSSELQSEREKNKLLEARYNELKQKVEAANKEQEALIDIFSEERGRRDREEETLRKKLKDASNTIQELLEKVASKV